MYTFARMRMGLSKPEFFSLTPRLFEAMRRAWLADRRDLQTALALVRCDLINFSMRAPKKRVELEDLLPSTETKPASPRRMSKKRRAAIADSWRQFMGGTQG